MALVEKDPKQEKRRIFIYGENGAGKTDLSLTPPGKKLVVDWFGNVVEVVRHRYPKELEMGEIKIVDGPRTFSDAMAMTRLNNERQLDPLIEWCDILILDNLTGLYRELTEDVCLNVPLKGNEGYRPSPETIILRDYGLSAERLRTFLGKVKDNISPRKHLIAICHTKLHKDKEGAVISGSASLPGEVPAFVMSLFPELIFLRVDPSGKRTAYFTHTGLFPAATRARDGKAVEHPNLRTLYEW